MFIDDKDVWSTCPTDYLWIYDKLILARKNGYLVIEKAPEGAFV